MSVLSVCDNGSDRLHPPGGCCCCCCLCDSQGEFEYNAFHGKGVFIDTEAQQWSGDFHNGNGPGLVNLL